VQEIVGRA